MLTLYLKFCRSSPTPPTISDHQPYDTQVTYDSAYDPTTTDNPAYGPVTTYNEAHDYVDLEYEVLDSIKDSAPPRLSPIPAVDYNRPPNYRLGDPMANT